MIKNYTSGVPVERTINRIEGALIRGGAIGISKEYREGLLEAIHFLIPNIKGPGMTIIRLPGDAKAVYKAMLDKMKRPREETLKRLQDQAARTAWKLIQDWLVKVLKELDEKLKPKKGKKK